VTNLPTTLDRSTLLLALAHVADAVQKAEVYDNLKEEVDKNITLLELDIARKRRSKSPAARIDLAGLQGMLQAYKDMRRLMGGPN
jgi:hypothetical protein